MEKTLTQILEEVKEENYSQYCKYTEDCINRMEDNEEPRKCPLDRL